MKPAEQPPPKMPEPLTPRREASQKIVLLGTGYLEKNELDKAVQTFQEAINVDSENGVAYFYLAKALSQKEAYDDALGLLDRARALLSNDPDWTAQVLNLKMLIEGTKQTPPAPKPTGQEVYY